MNPGSIEAKKHNIAAIARTIYDQPGISRKELGSRFGLSPSTVTLAVTALQELDLVAECGQEQAAAGRRARLLEINPHRGSVLILRLGEDFSLELTLCGLWGARLDRQLLPPPEERPQQARFCRLLADAARQFLDRTPRPLPLLAAAVITPGVMNPDGTADIGLFGWEDLSLSGLSEALQVPVYYDSILQMLGSYEIRQLPPADRQIYLSLEPGVGMAAYEQGRAVTGRNLLYGEIGHISMHEDGPPCYCGNRGCLEYYCGIPGLLSRMEEAARRCPILASLCSGGLTPEALPAAARQGSAAAAQLLEQVACELGRALVTLTNLLDPDQIIIAGRLWQYPEVREPALELVSRRALARSRQMPRILPAALPPDRTEPGICHFVFERWLDSRL